MNIIRLAWVTRLLRGVAALVVSWTVSPALAQAQDDGETLFKNVCGACHTVGAGKLIGPDLKGVQDRREEAWLLKFIKSSQAVVTSGDPVATGLFEEFNKVPMPDSIYTEEQHKVILAWITKLTKEGGTFSLVAQTPMAPATPEDIERGEQLFQGKIRLSGGGPSCISCHDVQNDAVIGGGVLAKELTSVFTRVGGPGVLAILGKPPFPVMERAYRGKELNEDEIRALVGFLQEADAQKAFQQPRDYGVKLFFSGVAGLVVLMGLYAALWGRRKKRSVNHDIYERQVRSS